jgi:hypothetical protein
MSIIILYRSDFSPKRKRLGASAGGNPGRNAHSSLRAKGSDLALRQAVPFRRRLRGGLDAVLEIVGDFLFGSAGILHKPIMKASPWRVREHGVSAPQRRRRRGAGQKRGGSAALPGKTANRFSGRAGMKRTFRPGWAWRMGFTDWRRGAAVSLTGAIRTFVKTWNRSFRGGSPRPFIKEAFLC